MLGVSECWGGEMVCYVREFGVSASSALLWVRPFQATGESDRRSKLIVNSPIVLSN